MKGGDSHAVQKRSQALRLRRKLLLARRARRGRALPREGIAAAVLAGGKSSRMGRDKSLIRLKGRTLSALAALRLLRAGYAPVFVVGPKKRYGLPQGVAVIPDLHPGLGPLAGLEAALQHSRTDTLLVPCDMPFLSAALLRRLRLAHSPGRVSALRNPRGPQPLPAVYPARLLAAVRRRLRARRLALFPLLKGARLLPAPPASLRNWNTAASLPT